jgi:hypothetical protein
MYLFDDDFGFEGWTDIQSCPLIYVLTRRDHPQIHSQDLEKDTTGDI